MDARYINLSRRTDRDESMKRRLGGAAERFEAVEVSFSDLGPMVENGFLTVEEYVILIGGRTSYITRGCVGCYLSHLALYRECAAAGRPMLILEDDVEVLPGLFARIEEGMASVENDFDIIYLDQPLNRWKKHSEPVNNVFFAVSDGYYCTDGYVVHPRHAALLAGVLEKRFLGHVDNAILTIHHRLGRRPRVLLFREPLIRKASMGSDIRVPRPALRWRSGNTFFCSGERAREELLAVHAGGIVVIHCFSEQDARREAEEKGGWFVPERLRPFRPLVVPDPGIARIGFSGTEGGFWRHGEGERVVFPAAVWNFFFAERE